MNLEWMHEKRMFGNRTQDVEAKKKKITKHKRRERRGEKRFAMIHILKVIHK
jgi:hypothetical protein